MHWITVNKKFLFSAGTEAKAWLDYEEHDKENQTFTTSWICVSVLGWFFDRGNNSFYMEHAFD